MFRIKLCISGLPYPGQADVDTRSRRAYLRKGASPIKDVTGQKTDKKEI